MSEQWRISGKTERGLLLTDEYGREIAEVFDGETAIGIARAMNGFNSRATRAEDDAADEREARESDVARLHAIVDMAVAYRDAMVECAMLRTDPRIYELARSRLFAALSAASQGSSAKEDDAS